VEFDGPQGEKGLEIRGLLGYVSFQEAGQLNILIFIMIENSMFGRLGKGGVKTAVRRGWSCESQRLGHPLDIPYIW
jgi:hypothetical protein